MGRQELTWDIASQTFTTNHVSHGDVAGAHVLPGYLLSHLFNVSILGLRGPHLPRDVLISSGQRNTYHTPPMPWFFSYTTRSIFLSRSGILIAAQIPENPAPTTRILSRLRFSTGSSFKEKAAVPSTVFPPEPFAWAISSALICCLWRGWLSWVRSGFTVSLVATRVRQLEYAIIFTRHPVQQESEGPGLIGASVWLFYGGRFEPRSLYHS